jgi:DNA-binding GntR family transcriptional regulator
MLDEIADGTLVPKTHLVQESLAERYGISRQPIQQALLLLKNDGERRHRPGCRPARADRRPARPRDDARHS